LNFFSVPVVFLKFIAFERLMIRKFIGLFTAYMFLHGAEYESFIWSLDCKHLENFAKGPVDFIYFEI